LAAEERLAVAHELAEFIGLAYFVACLGIDRMGGYLQNIKFL